MKIFKEHRDRQGGKLLWFVAPTPAESESVESFETLVKQLVDHGVHAIYVHGAAADPLVKTGKGATLAKFVEIMKATGLPAGVAAHDLVVIKYCEANRVPCDYYVKTFHSLNYSSAPKPEDIQRPFA